MARPDEVQRVGSSAAFTPFRSLHEIETPAFKLFLKKAVAAFEQNLKKMQTKPEDMMPWKINGERWHLSDKGFQPGKKVEWDRGLSAAQHTRGLATALLQGLITGALVVAVFEKIFYVRLP